MVLYFGILINVLSKWLFRFFKFLFEFDRNKRCLNFVNGRLKFLMLIILSLSGKWLVDRFVWILFVVIKLLKVNFFGIIGIVFGFGLVYLLFMVLDLVWMLLMMLKVLVFFVGRVICNILMLLCLINLCFGIFFMMCWWWLISVCDLELFVNLRVICFLRFVIKDDFKVVIWLVEIIKEMLSDDLLCEIFWK